jgi:hypothetical protein
LSRSNGAEEDNVSEGFLPLWSDLRNRRKSNTGRGLWAESWEKQVAGDVSEHGVCGIEIHSGIYCKGRM